MAWISEECGGRMRRYGQQGEPPALVQKSNLVSDLPPRPLWLGLNWAPFGLPRLALYSVPIATHDPAGPAAAAAHFLRLGNITPAIKWGKHSLRGSVIVPSYLWLKIKTEGRDFWLWARDARVYVLHTVILKSQHTVSCRWRRSFMHQSTVLIDKHTFSFSVRFYNWSF